MELLTGQKFITEYLTTKKLGTQRRHRVDIDLRIRPFFRFRPLDKILPSHCETFLSEVLQTLSPKSANNCISLLRLIFKKCVEWRWLRESPMLVKNISLAETPYTWWENKEEIARFLEVAKKDRYYAALRLAIELGPRLGEIVGLSKQDIDFERGQIRIHRQWLEKEKCYGPPKHNKVRHLNFSPTSELAEALRNAVAKSGDAEIIFTTRSGKRVSASKLAEKHFKRLGRLANNPPISFHDMRHTFASWYMIEVGDIWSLMGILGHSNIETTMRYAHLSTKHQKVASFSWN